MSGIPSTRPSLQLALTEIYRKARADQQEGGANTLFLTIGSLLWRQKNRATAYRAPLILIPVVLERPSVRSGFVLRAHDDETRLNSTLLEMLRQDFAIRFPALEAQTLPDDHPGFDVAPVLDTFRAKLRDIAGWEVRDEVALTTLSFTKFLMWKDLADRSERIRESELARRLMDGPVRDDTPDEPRPAADQPAAGALDEAFAAVDLICPLEADSSQLHAVARAAAGESFVLIGPPGTGKSQTIANLIVNTMAQGRTVLFVAEKRAALEVVQRRLRQVGLADFCLDLFSSKANKTAVLEQLDRAQSAHDLVDEAAWREAQAAAAALREELNFYVRDLHRTGRNGWTPFRAIGSVLRADDGGVPEIALSWPDRDQHDAADWRRLVEVTEEARATLERVGEVAGSPVLAGITRPDWSPLWQARLLEAARGAAARLTALEQAATAAAAVLTVTDAPASRRLLEGLVELSRILLDPLAADAAWAVSDDAASLRQEVADAAITAARHRSLQAGLVASWRPGVMALPLVEIRAQWRQAAARWAPMRMLARRAVRKRLAAEATGPVPKQCDEELDRLVEMQAFQRTLAASPHAAAFGVRWRGIDTDFDHLLAVHAWAQRLRAATAGCAADPASLIALRAHLRQIVAEAVDLLAAGAQTSGVLARLIQAWDDTTASLAEVSALSGTDAEALAPSDTPDWAGDVARHLAGWSEAARSIQDWCAWRGIAQAAGALGLGPLIAALEQRIVAPADAVRTLEANYARWWVNLAVDASPRLRGFVAARHETRIARFRALDSQLLALAARLARARIAAGIPAAVERQHDPEYAVLTRELAKRQRHLPVRQLALKMPQALRRLTPCLMMSPLSVAQYLPPESPPFDLVVFDEASQIPTWDAIGAVGRGRQVIVVGDPKQLPPTTFFERRIGEDDDAAIEVETQDLDSILDECLGAGIPSVALNWHYRSRHESLIAFSNAAYYGGRLVTFPSPVTRDAAVSFRHVPDGVYARGVARTNDAEARAVVAETLSILRAEPPRSVGVVTFNAEQQSLIEDLLDRARRDDPSLERHFGDDVAEPVLIKNLEGVQGEERDVMLFSLTYGPDQAGRIMLNFGPLNLSGGERRLNVAVTRARERLVVFGSLRAEQIDLSRTAAVGVAHLKQFLAFAEQGARALATASARPLGSHESFFEEQVAARLRRRGWVVHSQVGVSGFRIDLAVVDPDAPGAYLAGIECDGATYHRGATARDRDRLRQTVLEGLGWSILRVWSTDWWTNAEREADRMHAALAASQARAREARAARLAAAEHADAAGPHDAPAEDTTQGFGTDEDAGALASVLRRSARDAALADGTLFYDDAYRPRLAAIVAGAVADLGPVREDRLVQHVARLHGFQRAGREIRDRVEAVIPGDCTRSDDDGIAFIWPPGVVPAEWHGFRPPAPGDVRDPGDLPIEELVALARQCGARGSPGDVVLTAMRDACGLRRLGDAARRRCVRAIELCRRQSGNPDTQPH
jgi:very-short-patch-repair endonuclease